MKTSLFLSVLWLAIASLFSSSEPSYLTGTVTDTNGGPLFGASIKITKGTDFIVGAIADFDGKFKIAIEPGQYTVQVSYTGFESLRYEAVTIKPEKDYMLDVKMTVSVLPEITISTCKVPLIEYNKPAGGQILSSDEIKNLPTRNVNGISATKARKETAAKSSARIKAPAKSESPMGAAPVKPAVYAPAAGEAEPMKISSPPPAEEGFNPYRGNIFKDKVLSPPPPVEAPADDIIVVDGRKKRIEIVFEPETYEEKVMVIDIEDGKIYEESHEAMADEAAPGTIPQPKPRAGLLTAGEWNDLHNWDRHWTDLIADGEIASYEEMYGFFVHQRYTVMLSNEQDVPLADVIVQLKNAGEIIWEARTDNTGKAELWAGLYDKKEFGNLSAEAWINGKKHDLGMPKPAKAGFNFIKINAPCSAPTAVDIVWAVDATGSMGDEIEYLKTEVLDVIARAKNNNPDLSFRMGTAFYRDKGDDYVVKSSGLTPDINNTVAFIQQQFAGGGGDYPEAVHSALEEVVYKQKWSENAIARICFLVLDASPHQNPEVIASMQKSIREAARLGIRIVPLAASGIQKDTEFLMKFFGLATNGSYLFLTDHSGIGGKHLEPTSDEYKVEPLNDLFVRIITEYTSIKSCEGKSNIRFENDPQQDPGQAFQATYYPNPVVDQFTIELPFEVQSITLYDSEGKGVRKLEKPQAGQNIIRVNDLAAGFYTIRILNNGRMQSGKLMVVRS